MKLEIPPSHFHLPDGVTADVNPALSNWWTTVNVDLQPRPESLAESDTEDLLTSALGIEAVEGVASGVRAGLADIETGRAPLAVEPPNFKGFDVAAMLEGFDAGDLVAAPLSPDRRALLNGAPAPSGAPRIELRLQRGLDLYFRAPMGYRATASACDPAPRMRGIDLSSVHHGHYICRNPPRFAGDEPTSRLWEDLLRSFWHAHECRRGHPSPHEWLALLHYLNAQQQSFRVHDSIAVKAARLVQRLLFAHDTIRERADWLSGSFCLSVARSVRPIDVITTARTHSFIVVSGDRNNQEVWLAWSSADLHLPKQRIAHEARACMDRWLRYPTEHPADIRVLALLSESASLHQFANSLGVGEEQAVRRIAACLRNADFFFAEPKEILEADASVPSFGLVVAEPSQPCVG